MESWVCGSDDHPPFAKFLALLFKIYQFYQVLLFWGVKSKTYSSMHSLKLLFEICCLLGLIRHFTGGSPWPLCSYTLLGYKRMLPDTTKSYYVRARSTGHHSTQAAMPASVWPSSDPGAGWVCILWKADKLIQVWHPFVAAGMTRGSPPLVKSCLSSTL